MAETVTEETPNVTEKGDIWLIGNHRLMCGDSTSQDDVNHLMAGKTTNLLFTSPPYGNQRNYIGQENLDWTKLMQGISQVIPWNEDTQVLINLGMVHIKGEWQPYWDDWLEWMRTIGWRRFGLYIWDQGSGLPGDWNGRFAPRFEFLFHFNKKARQPNKIIPCSHAGKMTEEDKRGGLRNKTGVDAVKWTHAGKPIQEWRIPDAIVEVHREATSGIQREHPAVFPAKLPEFIIKSYTNEEEIVYEPFSGSGTTMIAAENTNRKARSMDIAPQYVDVAVRRWDKMFPSYHKAILELTGESFEQVSEKKGIKFDDSKFRTLTGTKKHTEITSNTLESFFK